MTKEGIVPFTKEENDRFNSFALDGNGSKLYVFPTFYLIFIESKNSYLRLLCPIHFNSFYYDYVGKLLPILDDSEYSLEARLGVKKGKR